MLLNKIIQKDYTSFFLYYQIKLPLDLEISISSDNPVRLVSAFVEEMEIIDSDVTSGEETPIESAIIGGADEPTTIILRKNQNDNAYTEDGDDYATEDSGIYDEESNDEWTAMGDKIKSR